MGDVGGVGSVCGGGGVGVGDGGVSGVGDDDGGGGMGGINVLVSKN